MHPDPLGSRLAPAAPADTPSSVSPPLIEPLSGLHRRLTINSASNVSTYAVSLVIAFLLTPFIVRTLGDSLYGFWVLLMSFIGYASILEMGVQPAVVKLVGHYRGRGELDKLSQLLSTALFFFLGAGAVAAVVLAFVLPPFVARFVLVGEAIPHSRLLFMVIAADALVMFANLLFAGILYGWQLYYAKNLIDIVAWLVNAGLLVLFLVSGGMVALAACKLGTDLLALGANVIVCRRAFPELRFATTAVGRRSFHELLGFGSRVFVSATTMRIATHAQPLIISAAHSSAATAFFAVPARLVDYVRQTIWGLSTGFMPMFSELEGREESDLLESLYLRYSRYLFALILPMIVLLLVFGGPFIALWIGPEYAERGTWVLRLLALTALADSFQPLLWRFFIGVGQLDVLVRVSAASSGLVILSSLLLVGPLGIAGVAGSVVGGMLLSQVVFAIQSCKYFHMSLGSLLGQVHLRPSVASLPAILVAWGLASILGTDSYAKILLGALCILLVHAVLVWWVALSGQERAWVSGQVQSRLRRRLV